MVRTLSGYLTNCQIYVPAKLAKPNEQQFTSIVSCIQSNFYRYDAHVIIAATGIVVRAIAPLVRNKQKDLRDRVGAPYSDESVCREAPQPDVEQAHW